jgi:hypothetical protein
VADTKEDGLGAVRVDGLVVEWKTYVIVLLTVLGEESGGGSHCQSGSERMIFRKNVTMNQKCELDLRSRWKIGRCKMVDD